MPAQASRHEFLQRFNPLDLSTLSAKDTEPLRLYILGGRLENRFPMSARLLMLADAAYTLRALENRGSWDTRIANLLAMRPYDGFLVVANTTLGYDALIRSDIARETAIRTHRMLRSRMGNSNYGILRRERKHAWRAFVRTMVPAIRLGITIHIRHLLAHP